MEHFVLLILSLMNGFKIGRTVQSTIKASSSRFVRFHPIQDYGFLDFLANAIVVMTTTPFRPASPYFSTAGTSFNTSIDWISLGSSDSIETIACVESLTIWADGTTFPSIMNNGLEPERASGFGSRIWVCCENANVGEAISIRKQMKYFIHYYL